MSILSGYLRKYKRDIFLPGNTNKRWFELNFDKQTFSIKNSQENPNYNEIIKLNEIKEYHPFLGKNFQNVCDYKYGFLIKTIKRRYFLYAKTEEDKIKWEEAFLKILGKKNENEKHLNLRNTFYNSNSEEYTIFKVCHTQNESHYSSRKTSGDSNKEIRRNHKFNTINGEELNLIQRKNSVFTYSNNNIDNQDNNGNSEKKRKSIISFFY